MNRPDDELARKVVQHLDYGVDHLDPSIRERLRAARHVALSHYRDRPEPVLGRAWAGQAMARFAGHYTFGARHWVAVATLILALAGIVYWQSLGPANELADIDMNLLTDELPINAYLDKGFDSWLKRAPR
jgi:hypothetical protein